MIYFGSIEFHLLSIHHHPNKIKIKVLLVFYLLNHIGIYYNHNLYVYFEKKNDRIKI